MILDSELETVQIFTRKLWFAFKPDSMHVVLDYH